VRHDFAASAQYNFFGSISSDFDRSECYHDFFSFGLDVGRQTYVNAYALLRGLGLPLRLSSLKVVARLGLFRPSHKRQRPVPKLEADERALFSGAVRAGLFKDAEQASVSERTEGGMVMRSKMYP
jgi:hypothetical protein